VEDEMGLSFKDIFNSELNNFIADEKKMKNYSGQDYPGQHSCPPECRRNYTRERIEDFAELSIPGKLEGPIVLKNFSEKGIGFESDFPLEQGQRCTVILRPPIFEDSVHRDIRVAWCKKADDHWWHGGLELNRDDAIKLRE